jgi:hypothetical protein
MPGDAPQCVRHATGIIMGTQSEQINLRVHAARQARINAQRMRVLAAERAEILERRLKDAADAGLRQEVLRGIAARAGLHSAAAAKNADTRAATPAAIPIRAGTLAAHAAGAPAPVVGAAPGEPLRLALSYSVSQPGKR